MAKKKSKHKKPAEAQPNNNVVEDTPFIPQVLENKDAAFNFNTVRHIVQPGAWRRGYGYFKTPGQIIDLKLNGKGVLGKVKGNFKAHYNTQLVFNPDGTVVTECDCPLKDTWCKHAVTVALTSILACPTALWCIAPHLMKPLRWKGAIALTLI